MISVSIREYSENDYNDVINIWSLTGMGGAERGDDHLTIQRSIDMGGKLLLLIEDDTAEVIGTSWMTYDGRRIHLHHFGILPYYQGKGLSKKLLKASLDFAREKGSQVKLEVHSTNVKAIKLYSSNGFMYLGDYDVYIIRDVHSI